MRLLLQTALSILLLAAPGVATTPEWLEGRSDEADLGLPSFDSSVPTPGEFLGYSLGQRFSRPFEILDYLSHLASSSDRMLLWEYGRTYEDRPLVLAAISSPENIARLEELRERQVRLAEPQAIAASEIEGLLSDAPVFVWLAYGIHGNEASSPEAAMATAFVLAAAQGPLAERLDEVVVLLDPLVNPDGRARYVHSFETRSGRLPDPDPGAAEHLEPWPGGRQNHYLIDLNRDWTWATQRETHARLREYRRWEPHVYVDFHEMSPRSTYFFPPSAEPIHSIIDSSTVRWLEVFGAANAQAFDARRWTYYVGENFDLFYPGYSDSYPSLRGAVGMTYEMAGHGRAGLAFERPDGSLLTLADRIARHLTTSLTTIETAVHGRERLARDFVAARRRAADSTGHTYVWRSNQGEAAAAAALLRDHGIKVTQLARDQVIKTRPLAGGESRARRFERGDFLLSTKQPLASLAEGLMELDPRMPETFLAKQRERLEQNRSTEFFDITAWSIPLAFNLETFITEATPASVDSLDAPPGEPSGDGSFGFLAKPQGLASYRFAASVLAQRTRVGLALSEFTQRGEEYPSGTLFIPRADDESAEALLRLAREAGVSLSKTATALSDEGISLGSDDVVPLRQPRLGLVGGEGVRATSFGFLWFLLDRDLRIPYSRLELSAFEKVDLAQFDTLILPSGSGYAAYLDQEQAARIQRWIEEGGVLVAIGDAIRWLQEHELTVVEEWKPENKDENGTSKMTPAHRSVYTPGAALAAVTHPGHPLTAGVEGSPAALFRGRTILLPSGDPRQDLVLVAEDEPVVAGFAWPEAEDRLAGSLLVGAERRAEGAVVVFSQEPLFRLFWRASATPFLNTLLYAPSLGEHGRLFQ